MPRHWPAAPDSRLFAPRFISDAPASVDAELQAVAATDSEPPTSEQEYRRQVGRRARLVRVGLNLSQDEVAAQAGLTRNFVSAIERGAQGLDAWRLRHLAAALGVTPTWLLSLT